MIFYGGLHPGVGNGRRALVVFLGFGVGETELELGRSMMLRTFGPLLSDPGKPNRGKPCEGGQHLAGQRCLWRRGFAFTTAPMMVTGHARLLSWTVSASVIQPISLGGAGR